MKTTYSDTYKVSERIVLTPGDTFRISGGPYWRMSDGSKIPMAVRGVCRFVRAVHRGKLVLLEAFTQEGYTVLHVEGGRKRIDRALVALVLIRIGQELGTASPTAAAIHGLITTAIDLLNALAR